MSHSKNSLALMVGNFRLSEIFMYLKFHQDYQKNEILHWDAQFLSGCYFQYIKRGLFFPPRLQNQKERQGGRQAFLKDIPRHGSGRGWPQQMFPSGESAGLDPQVSKWSKDPSLVACEIARSRKQGLPTSHTNLSQIFSFLKRKPQKKFTYSHSLNWEKVEVVVLAFL